MFVKIMFVILKIMFDKIMFVKIMFVKIMFEKPMFNLLNFWIYLWMAMCVTGQWITGTLSLHWRCCECPELLCTS